MPISAGSFLRYRRGLVVITDDRRVIAPLRRDSDEALFVELSPGHALHRALAVARELKLPPVATSHALLLQPEDLHLHRVLRAIHLNTKLSRLQPEQTASDSDLLFPPAKMTQFFPHC